MSEEKYFGPVSPLIVFVISDAATPTLVERIRGEPFVNDDREIFRKRYLEPLGVERERCGFVWGKPDRVAETMALLKEKSPRAKVYLGDIRGAGPTSVNLDRFARSGDVWKSSHQEEATRKLRALRKKLDAEDAVRASCIRTLLKAAWPQDAAVINGERIASVFKARAPDQVIYGVVLDPYQVDLQDDWIPPADVQQTAWDYVAKRGYVSDQHEAVAPDAFFVESHLEDYPSRDDYEKAMANLPHRAFRRKFGDDVVHSGAWILGVKLGDRLWADYESGRIDAFSIEGFGTRTPATTADMPRVTFVDVEVVGGR